MIRQAVCDGNQNEVTRRQSAIAAGMPAQKVLSGGGLIPGMQELGARFEDRTGLSPRSS